jgi:hypothetical protein
MLFLITFQSKSQTATTFTATEVMVTNSITAGGAIRGQCITANDTLRAKDEVVAEQDLKVAGDINLAGNLFLNYSSGLKVIAPNSLTGNGPIVVVGNPNNPAGEDDPSACIVGTKGWLTPGNGLGFYTSYNIGLNRSTLSMIVENNSNIGNGYIDMGGSLNGNNPGDLFINQKCLRNTKINLAGGTVFMGDQVRMNKYVEVGPASGASTGFGQPLFKININAGTGMEVNTTNNNIKSYSINNFNTNPYTVFGDGRVQLLTAQTNNKMLVVGDINAITNIEKFVVYGDGRTYIGVQKPILTGPHANAKLAVDGKILAKEIYVNIHNSVWADYVFEKNYKLMPLNEVEIFVNKNKHLPNVPSGNDLTETDDYNLSLSDMQKIQMEKIEELYLHAIQQQKEIELLKKENKELKELIKR